jgi:predicted ribosome quality control (RQC) complex YloA/Tae2 family protein
LPVTLIGTAKTVISTALLIKDFAEGRDKAAKEVYAIDQALWKIYMGPKMKGKAFKSAQEVAVAAGVPFIDSVGKLETRLEDFLGKSARVDKDRQKLFENANKLQLAIKTIDSDKAGADNAKRLKTIGDKVTSMLDEIHALARSVDGDNAFYRTNSARCRVYRQLNGAALTVGAQAVTYGVLVAGIVATAKAIVDIAVALA